MLYMHVKTRHINDIKTIIAIHCYTTLWTRACIYVCNSNQNEFRCKSFNYRSISYDKCTRYKYNNPLERSRAKKSGRWKIVIDAVCMKRRVREISRAARVELLVSPRDVSRNMRALEKPGRASALLFLLSLKPVLRDSRGNPPCIINPTDIIPERKDFTSFYARRYRSCKSALLYTSDLSLDARLPRKENFGSSILYI